MIWKIILLALHMIYKFYAFNNNNVAAFENYSTWFSKPSLFNDPFEGIYIDNTIDMSDREFIDFCRAHNKESKILKMLSVDEKIDFESWLQSIYVNSHVPHIKKELSRISTGALKEQQVKFYNSGVCCFIMGEELNPTKNNLMWGHYGDGLKGFALEISTDPHDAFDESLIISHVKYNDTPPKLDANQLAIKAFNRNNSLEDKNETIESLLKITNTKHTHWKYENEIRFIAFEKGNSLIRLRDNVISSIYIGNRMPNWQKASLIHIAKKNNIENIYEAYANNNSYTVGIRPLVMP